MAIANFIYTTSAKLNEIPVEDGRIIFAPDSNTIALDMKGNRFYYQTIKTFSTEADREITPFLDSGFYYVEETNAIWRWSGKWVLVTSSGSGSVVEGNTEEDFPTEGSHSTLYYTDDGIYSWKNAANKYNLIANANTWESI